MFEAKELGPVLTHVLPNLPLHVDMVVGLDVILREGLYVGGKADQMTVRFGAAENIASASVISEDVRQQELRLTDEDFEARCARGTWEVEWKWKGGITYTKASFPHNVVSADEESDFDAEVMAWVEDGILVKHDVKEHGPVRNFIPMMAVQQRKGGVSKVRPVLDYRGLNTAIESHPGGAVPICADRLREWRQIGPECAVIDLKRAYLQVGVTWMYLPVDLPSCSLER